MAEGIGSPDFDFDTFLDILYRHAREADPEGELIRCFRVFDKNKTGKLKTAAVRQILASFRRPFTDDQIADLMSQADIDENDEVLIEDFVKSMLDF
jgi:calmodulin